MKFAGLVLTAAYWLVAGPLFADWLPALAPKPWKGNQFVYSGAIVEIKLSKPVLQVFVPRLISNLKAA